MSATTNSANKRRTGEETRALVIDTAIALIESHGTTLLKINEVARVSGVSEAMIYRHFDDRAGVLTAALTTMWERYMTEPLVEARAMIDALPDSAITPEFLATVGIHPNTEMARKQRWARLQVLAVANEIPELGNLIRLTQTRINREHEALIELVRSKMPGLHVPSARVMRMLNQNVMFGYVLEDMVDDPIAEEELRSFLVQFFQRMYEPEQM